MPIIQLGKNNIHIQEINKGASEPVIMVHGMFSNLSVYYFNIANFLAEKFHVVMYDLKGHGMSTKALSGYDLTTMTDDLLALMEALNLQSTHLVGYSYGGLIALKMTVRFPEKIKRLAVIEAPDPREEETLEKSNEYSKESLVEYVNNNRDKMPIQMGKRQLERNHRMYDFLFNKTTLKVDLAKERNFFNGRETESIQHEALLLYGNDSACLESGYLLQSKIKKSKLVLVNGDHNIPIQEPVTIGKELKDFFEADGSVAQQKNKVGMEI